MKQKKYFILAAAAILMAACSENDIAEKQSPQENVEKGAVLFDSYVQRSITRSGATGTMTYDLALSRKLTTTGFGVFGYYTDNKEYEGLTIPDFFYNQKVTYDSYWKYEPVKYWPNEYGSSAIADDNDKVSYFAYAPYVDVTPGSGKPSDQTFGIALLSRNSAKGDPYVKYIATFDWTKAVDLLWGVVPTEKTGWNITSGETQTLKAGLPWLNVERPKEAATQNAATQRVKFQFQHALSKLNVQIDYDADRTTHAESGNELAEATRVYVRSVSFTGFAMKGALNLNNVQPNVPLWKAYDAENDLAAGEVIVVSDGRKDGKEGVGGAVAPNEPNIFLNPAIIQTGAWSGDNKGVLNKYQNLFAYPASEKVAEDMKLLSPSGKIDIASLTDFDEAVGVARSNGWNYQDDANAAALLSWPIMVIPNGDEISVTIVYDVETVDNNLATKLSDGTTLGSSIENRITKTITFSNSDKNYMEAGKKYTIKLHLGLNSVKFDAAVTGWDDGAEGEAWLPDNEVSYQAPGVYNYNVLAGANKFGNFKLTGFAANEDINTEVTTVTGAPVSGSLANSPADSKGEITITGSTAFTITPNIKVTNVTTDNAIKFTGITSGKQIVLNLVQAAAQPDGTKSEVTVTPGSKDITFALKDAAGTALEGDIWTGDTRNVQIISATRNGVPMTELSESDTPNTATQFQCSDAGKITLGTAAVLGEKFIFTIKAGDASEFTVKKECSTFAPLASTNSVEAKTTTTNVDITGEDYSSGYTASYTKDNGTPVDMSVSGQKFVLSVPAADYNKHTYVVTVTKTANSESHSVTITQDAVTLSGLTATYTPSTYILKLENITVSPNIETWSWTGSTVTVKDSDGKDVTKVFVNNGDGTLTRTGSLVNGTYTVTVTKGDCSISVDFEKAG